MIGIGAGERGGQGYRNYWKEAGYLDEMNAAETAITAGRTDEHPYIDRSLAGGLHSLRPGGPHPRREQWCYAGITTPGLDAALTRQQSDDRAHGGLCRLRAVTRT
jgi:hypothetical protein